MANTSYALALGSNRRSIHGSPAQTLRAAVAALAEVGEVEALSTIRTTAAVGPGGRGFANAATILSSGLDPPDLLCALKQIEQAFGRRSGQRWGARVLDLDILLWSGGVWGEVGLVVPHPALSERLFVLQPLAEIAPGWRHPLSQRSIRQLLFRRSQARQH